MSAESDVLMQQFRQAVYERLTNPGIAHGLSPEGAIEQRSILFRNWQSGLQAGGEEEHLGPDLARHWAVADVTAFRDIRADRQAIAEDDIFKNISVSPAYGQILSSIDTKLFEQVKAAGAANEQKIAEKLDRDVRELEQVRREGAVLVDESHDGQPADRQGQVAGDMSTSMSDGARDKSSNERLAVEGAVELIKADAMSLSAEYADDSVARRIEKAQARRMEDEAYKKLAAVQLGDARAAVAAEREKITSDSQLKSSVRFDDDKHQAAVEAQARRQNADTSVPRAPELPEGPLAMQQRREALSSDTMGLERQQENGFRAGPESDRDEPALEPADPAKTISKVLENATYKTRLDGSVLYLIDKRPAFVDHGKQIIMEPKAKNDEEAILAAVLLAKEKYGGAFEVTGSDTFKRRAIEIMLKHQLDVTLKNPEQEALRRELARGGQAASEPSAPANAADDRVPVKPMIGKPAPDQDEVVSTKSVQASDVITQGSGVDDRAEFDVKVPHESDLAAPPIDREISQPSVGSVELPVKQASDGAAQEPHPSGLIPVRALDWWSVQHAAIHIWAKNDAERQADLEQLGPAPGDSLVYWFDRSGEQRDAPADAVASVQRPAAADDKLEAAGFRPVAEEELRMRGATGNSEVSAGSVLNVNLKEFDMAAVLESNDQDPKLILRGVKKLDNGEFDTTVLLFKGKGDYLQGYVKVGDQKHQVIAHINERKPDQGTGEVKPNFLKLSEPHAVGDDTKWKEIGFGNAVNRRKDDKPVFFDEVLFSVGNEVVKARVTKHVDADMHRQLGFDESRKARPKEDSPAAAAGDASPKPKAPAAKEKEDAAGAKETARSAAAPKAGSPKSGAPAAAANEDAAGASKVPRSRARARG